MQTDTHEHIDPAERGEYDAQQGRAADTSLFVSNDEVREYLNAYSDALVPKFITLEELNRFSAELEVSQWL